MGNKKILMLQSTLSLIVKKNSSSINKRTIPLEINNLSPGNESTQTDIFPLFGSMKPHLKSFLKEKISTITAVDDNVFWKNSETPLPLYEGIGEDQEFLKDFTDLNTSQLKIDLPSGLGNISVTTGTSPKLSIKCKPNMQERFLHTVEGEQLSIGLVNGTYSREDLKNIEIKITLPRLDNLNLISGDITVEEESKLSDEGKLKVNPEKFMIHMSDNSHCRLGANIESQQLEIHMSNNSHCTVDANIKSPQLEIHMSDNSHCRLGANIESQQLEIHMSNNSNLVLSGNVDNCKELNVQLKDNSYCNLKKLNKHLKDLDKFVYRYNSSDISQFSKQLAVNNWPWNEEASSTEEELSTEEASSTEEAPVAREEASSTKAASVAREEASVARGELSSTEKALIAKEAVSVAKEAVSVAKEAVSVAREVTSAAVDGIVTPMFSLFGIKPRAHT